MHRYADEMPDEPSYDKGLLFALQAAFCVERRQVCTHEKGTCWAQILEKH